MKCDGEGVRGAAETDKSIDTYMDTHNVYFYVSCYVLIISYSFHLNVCCIVKPCPQALSPQTPY